METWSDWINHLGDECPVDKCELVSVADGYYVWTSLALDVPWGKVNAYRRKDAPGDRPVNPMAMQVCSEEQVCEINARMNSTGSCMVKLSFKDGVAQVSIVDDTNAKEGL